jgi:hypothetical protein
MKAIWVAFAAISFVAAAVIWLFASGWGGGVPWLPDTQLLTTGEWPWWVIMVVLLYGPVAAGAWCVFKAIRETD